MKILLIEDDTQRIGWFRERFASHELTITTTVADAIAAVSGGIDYDIGFFDHDLGIGGDVYNVATFIEKRELL